MLMRPLLPVWPLQQLDSVHFSPLWVFSIFVSHRIESMKCQSAQNWGKLFSGKVFWMKLLDWTNLRCLIDYGHFVRLYWHWAICVQFWCATQYDRRWFGTVWFFGRLLVRLRHKRWNECGRNRWRWHTANHCGDDIVLGFWWRMLLQFLLRLAVRIWSDDWPKLMRYKKIVRWTRARYLCLKSTIFDARTILNDALRLDNASGHRVP